MDKAIIWKSDTGTVDPMSISDDDNGSDGDDAEVDDEDIGDWLDEKSRGPVSETPGSSRLCNACKNLFTECQPFGRMGLGLSDSVPYLV